MKRRSKSLGVRDVFGWWPAKRDGWPRSPLRVHGDQAGSISIISVFALLLIVMLLGMVMNTGRVVDQKIKMQNAADAATQAGGAVMARSMNALAFTNHLLADVFALTAFMREAQARSAESLTPEILDNWERMAPSFTGTELPRYEGLDQAILEKVPAERELVRTYSDWSAAAAEILLPVLEDILVTRAIPEYQTALVETTPQLAQTAADQVARRHGAAWPRSTRLDGVLWRTVADPVGGVSESQWRSLPVVDPVSDSMPNQEDYFNRAVNDRRKWANRYLRDWNGDMLRAFDRYGKMSQFGNLWRIFTCGQLRNLLEEEYPNSNLPFMIRTPHNEIENVNEHLEQDFMFVGVVYRHRLPDRMPGVFRNPIRTETLAFAQTMLFVPRRRLVWDPNCHGGRHTPLIGGMPGQNIEDPLYEPDPNEPILPPEDEHEVERECAGRRPEWWNLWSQNWTAQLAPATAYRMNAILSTPPYGNGVPSLSTPDFSMIDPLDFDWLCHH